MPFPAHGHVNPMLPVMAELVARGQDVRAAVPGGFADAVRSVGVRPVDLPEGFGVHVPDRVLPLDVPRWLRARLRRLGARRAAAEVVKAELAARAADLAVVDVMAPWGSRVAAGSGVPHVSFSTTFTRRRSGVMVVNAVPELQPVPGHLVGPLVREHDTVECDLPWQRIRESRTVLVSPGTVFARRPEFFRWIAEAFSGTDWTVVAASGVVDPRALGALPHNVVVRRRVPQLAVLKHAQAFVTHGGMNSVLESLAAGVPMVLAPRSREQRATSRRLVALGAGVLLSLPDVRRQVEQVSRTARTRRALQGAGVAGDHAGVVADFLQNLIRENARPAERTSP